MVRLIVIAIFLAGGASAQTVAPYVISDGKSIDAPLAGAEGIWQTGRMLYFDRKLTGCSGCHGSPGGPGAEIVAGNEGAPSLTGVAARLTEGEIRLWIAAPIAMNPETAMPSFHLAGQRTGPLAAIPNGPWLSAEEVEHLVAYLARQTEQE